MKEILNRKRSVMEPITKAMKVLAEMKQMTQSLRKIRQSSYVRSIIPKGN